MNDAPFIDYYDLMQVSPNADEDTIQRVFRHLAKKWHPDRSQGDPERFKLLVEAQRTLTNPATRAAYDIKYQMFWETKWKLAAEASDGRGFAEDKDVRERMLSLFYVQRRSKMHKPGLGEYEVARLMRIPIEIIEFHIWYLREKGWIQRLDNGPLAITALGVDEVEKGRLHLTPDRLLTSVASDSHSGQGQEHPEPDRCFPTHGKDLQHLDEAIRSTDVHEKKGASAEF